MRYRSCPLCFTRISRLQVLSHSNEVVCPACHATLELSRSNRVLGSLVGILAALLAFHYLYTSSPLTNWTLPMLAAILAFCFASALTLFLASDLVVHSQQISATFPHTKP